MCVIENSPTGRSFDIFSDFLSHISQIHSNMLYGIFSDVLFGCLYPYWYLIIDTIWHTFWSSFWHIFLHFIWQIVIVCRRSRCIYAILFDIVRQLNVLFEVCSGMCMCFLSDIETYWYMYVYVYVYIRTVRVAYLLYSQMTKPSFLCKIEMKFVAGEQIWKVVSFLFPQAECRILQRPSFLKLCQMQRLHTQLGISQSSLDFLHVAFKLEIYFYARHFWQEVRESILPCYGTLTALKWRVTAKNSHCKEQSLQRTVTTGTKKSHCKEPPWTATVFVGHSIWHTFSQSHLICFFLEL